MTKHDKNKDAFLENLKKKFGEQTVLLDSDDAEFTFSCEACGNCCKNRVNQDAVILSPYDTFNLCNNLDMDFGELYDKHLDSCLGSGSGLPVIFLDNNFNPNTFQEECTFLRKFNKNYRCMVQEFKPVVCAIYPLGRIGSYDLKDDKESQKLDYIFLSNDCSNIKKVNTHVHTLGTWIKDREITEKAFTIYTDAITDLVKKVNFRKFHDSPYIEEEQKEVLHSAMMQLLFVRYDFKKDFFEQFESNMKELNALVDLVVTMCLKKDNSIATKKFKKLEPTEMMKNLNLLVKNNKDIRF